MLTGIDHRVVVVGGSVAGLSAARSLRRRGFSGEILLVGEEEHPPYSRPPLSKQFLLNAAKTAADLYLPVDESLGIERLAGRRAVGLDVENRVVALDDGDSARFDGLVIATGSTPRRLPLPELDGVRLLRTVDDAVALRAEFARGPRVVVIGGGFIGCEVAATARKLGLDVTLVDDGPLPLGRVLGATAATAIRDLHIENGTRLRMGAKVERLLGTGRVEEVLLDTGEVIPADLVVVGVGVVPATDWLRGSGLQVDDGVLCDAHCRAVNSSHVVAAGDVARWYNPLFSVHMRVEHWNNATAQADAAVEALLSPATAQPYAHVPYFWSEQYDMRLQFVGRRPDDHEGRLAHGRTDERSFVLTYENRGRIVGALAVNRPQDLGSYRALIANGPDGTQVCGTMARGRTT